MKLAVVWGIICWFWSTGFPKTTVNEAAVGKLYRDAGLIFQQDLAPAAHTAKATKSFFYDCDGTELDAPVNFPDF